MDAKIIVRPTALGHFVAEFQGDGLPLDARIARGKGWSPDGAVRDLLATIPNATASAVLPCETVLLDEPAGV